MYLLLRENKPSGPNALCNGQRISAPIVHARHLLGEERIEWPTSKALLGKMPQRQCRRAVSRAAAPQVSGQLDWVPVFAFKGMCQSVRGGTVADLNSRAVGFSLYGAGVRVYVLSIRSATRLTVVACNRRYIKTFEDHRHGRCEAAFAPGFSPRQDLKTSHCCVWDHHFFFLGKSKIDWPR